MATNGVFGTSGYSGRYIEFYWERIGYDIGAPSSTIRWHLSAYGGSASHYTTGPVRCWVNGNLVYENTARVNMYKGEFASGDIVIPHNGDGTKWFSASVEAAIYSKAINCTGDGGWDLDTLPRNSYTDSAPNFTAPNGIVCYINRYASFSHTVCLDLLNTSGNWENVGTLYNQGTSATFNSEAVMKRCYEVLNGRASCTSRFTIYTNGPNGWTNGPNGTCYAAAANTINAPTFTGTNSATATITKGNGAFTSIITTLINGKSIGTLSNSSATSFTFNNTTALRKECITALAQTASKGYSLTITTYYSGVKVRSASTVNGTCNAPAVDRVTVPNFTAGNNFGCTITTDSSELTRNLNFQIQNSSGTWISIATVSNTSTTSFTWANTEAQRDILFNALNGAVSRAARILVTTYYSGVRVRDANVSTNGTCNAPAASTCTSPNWIAGNTFICTVNRSSSLLTHTITLQVKNSNGTYQTFGSVSKNSSTSINFGDTIALNTTLFNYLAQADARDTQIIITTYYKDIIVRSSLSSTGKVTAPPASTCVTAPTWIGGDSLSLAINRANSNFTHTVTVKVNSQLIITIPNVLTSTSFGTSDGERTKIFTALDLQSSKTSEISILTYYNGVQVRTATSRTGVCNAPNPVSLSSPSWTAGNSFQATITLSKTYLYHSIELKVGGVSVQKYNYQKDTSLGFAGTPEINLKAYQGLNTNAQATSQFIATMYYKTDSGNYIQVGAQGITNGTCTALPANTITAPNWTAGSAFSATVTRKSLNLYSKIKLKVNGQVVQEYGAQDASDLTYSLPFGNSVAVNTLVYTALAQTASKDAILEITTFFGTTKDNIVQVRTPILSSGVCRSSEPAVGNLTLSQTPAIIDNAKITCDLTRPLEEYTTKIEIRFNNILITTLIPTTNPNQVVLYTNTFMKELYQAIPTQKGSSLQFKVITYYNEVQVQQPKTIAVDLNANEDTVKVKLDTSVDFSTLSEVIDRENTFIDNESMIGSKVSDLVISMAKGYFYLQSKYGGYITQIRVQIANSSSMLQAYYFTEENIEYNLEKTRIVSTDFTSNKAVTMGPYDFPSVTEAGTINNLVITATDSRGYEEVKIIPLKIYPYSAPTIKIDPKLTTRIVGDAKYCMINLSGTISSFYKIINGVKTQTNTAKRITLEYKVYGSSGAFSKYNIPAINYNDKYTSYNVSNFSTAVANPGIEFNINDTFQFQITVEDQYGKTNTDSIIILPDRPLMSFREQQIGINIIPRKLASMIERASEDNENPALDINGYIYSNGREVPTFTVVSTWTS